MNDMAEITEIEKAYLRIEICIAEMESTNARLSRIVQSLKELEAEQHGRKPGDRSKANKN